MSIVKIDKKLPEFENLDSQIFDVFHYVRRVSNRKKPIFYDQLINKIIKRFNFDRTKTILILESFIQNQLIYLNEDKIFLNILANPIRKRILLLIQLYPAVNFNTIKNLLQIGSNQILWHVSILEKFHYIKLHQFGKITVYSLPKVPKNEVILSFLILKKSMRNLLKFLTDSPNGTTILKMVEELCQPRSNIIYSLNKFQEMNIIIKNKQKSPYIYELNSIFLGTILEILKKYQNLMPKVENDNI